MTRILTGQLDRLCDHCNGEPKMQKMEGLNVWICTQCSGFEYHYPRSMNISGNENAEIISQKPATNHSNIKVEEKQK